MAMALLAFGSGMASAADSDCPRPDGRICYEKLPMDFCTAPLEPIEEIDELICIGEINGNSKPIVVHADAAMLADRGGNDGRPIWVLKEQPRQVQHGAAPNTPDTLDASQRGVEKSDIRPGMKVAQPGGGGYPKIGYPRRATDAGDESAINPRYEPAVVTGESAQRPAKFKAGKGLADTVKKAGQPADGDSANDVDHSEESAQSTGDPIPDIDITVKPEND